MQVFLQLIHTFVLSVLNIVIGGLLISLPVMLLWNFALVGAIAGISAIGWFQAWGIMILCGFLFKSTGSK